MKVKTITYKRILNLGNYESKHLEASIEIPYITALGAEEECSNLMGFVETKIREDHVTSLQAEIRKLEDEIQNLRNTRKALKSLGENDQIPHRDIGEGGLF